MTDIKSTLKTSYLIPHTSYLKRKADRFTLIELLVVIAIISILATMLLPALGKAKKAGIIALCSSNLHSLNQAISLYSEDFQGYGPVSIDIYDACTTSSGYQLQGYFFKDLGDSGSLTDHSREVKMVVCPGADQDWLNSERRAPGRWSRFQKDATGIFNFSYALAYGRSTAYTRTGSSYKWGWFSYNKYHPLPTSAYLGKTVDGVTVPPPARQPLAGDPISNAGSFNLALNGLNFKVSHGGSQNTVFWDGHVTHLQNLFQTGASIETLKICYTSLRWPK